MFARNGSGQFSRIVEVGHDARLHCVTFKFDYLILRSLVQCGNVALYGKKRHFSGAPGV